jgi:hypothetical protein
MRYLRKEIEILPIEIACCIAFVTSRHNFFNENKTEESAEAASIK